jgi:hypothetical protein
MLYLVGGSGTDKGFISFAAQKMGSGGFSVEIAMMTPARCGVDVATRKL